MPNSLKCINITQLGTTFASALYTVPALTTFTVSMLHLANTTSSAVTVRVCVVPTGSALQSNAILWDFSIAANDVLEILKGDIWSTGTAIWADSNTATAVNLKLAGIETT